MSNPRYVAKASVERVRILRNTPPEVLDLLPKLTEMIRMLHEHTEQEPSDFIDAVIERCRMYEQAKKKPG